MEFFLKHTVQDRLEYIDLYINGHQVKQEHIYDIEQYKETVELCNKLVDTYSEYIHLQNMLEVSFPFLVILSDSLDIRHKLHLENKVERIYNNYRTSREKAYKECMEISKKTDVDFREEEKYNKFNQTYNFGLVILNKFSDLLDNLSESASDILSEIKRLRNENNKQT